MANADDIIQDMFDKDFKQEQEEEIFLQELEKNYLQEPDYKNDPNYSLIQNQSEQELPGYFEQNDIVNIEINNNNGESSTIKIDINDDNSNDKILDIQNNVIENIKDISKVTISSDSNSNSIEVDSYTAILEKEIQAAELQLKQIELASLELEKIKQLEATKIKLQEQLELKKEDLSSDINSRFAKLSNETLDKQGKKSKINKGVFNTLFKYLSIDKLFKNKNKEKTVFKDVSLDSDNATKQQINNSIYNQKQFKNKIDNKLKKFNNHKKTTSGNMHRSFSQNPDRLAEELIKDIFKPLDLLKEHVSTNNNIASKSQSNNLTPDVLKFDKEGIFIKDNNTKFQFISYNDDYSKINVIDDKGKKIEIDNKPGLIISTTSKIKLNKLQVDLLKNKGKNLLIDLPSNTKINNEVTEEKNSFIINFNSKTKAYELKPINKEQFEKQEQIKIVPNLKTAMKPKL